MLANGITLGYKTGEASSYTVLTGLKEVPEIGIQREKVNNTGLSDPNFKYEFGIGDPGDMVYRFKFENGASSSYRILSKLTGSVKFQQTMPDGTTFEFEGQTYTRVGGGGVNGVIEFTLSIAVNSAITITDPTS